MALKLWEKNVQVNEEIDRFTVRWTFIWPSTMYLVQWLI